MSETLEWQAVEAGIDLGYHDINGTYHATKPEVLESIVAVLEKSKPDSDGLYLNTMVAHENGEESLQMPSEFHGAEAVVLIDEADECQTLTLYPGDNDTLWIKLPQLACGYYILSAETGGKCCLVRLIVAPESVYQPKLLANGGRMNGLTMHLYSLRSKRNWGIGDFTDLLNLMKYAAEKKLDFVGINPLHALFTSKPAFASPYSPSSREWLNPIYLDIEKVGAFTYNEQLKNWLAQPKIRQRIAALRITETVTYTAVWACKRDALHMAFNAFEQDTCEAAVNERAAFEAFVLEKGKALQGFGLFEALDQYYSRPGQEGWQSWPSEFHQPDGEAVEKFARSHEREIRFYMWLQWLCAEQLQEVNQAAAEYGVKLGIYGDLAVGVARGSVDTWLNRQDYCMDVSVGAPPDPLGPTGQNWNLPPLNPLMLKHTGYEKFAHLLRENMRLYGVLRIDHVMALCRLWWVLNDKTADFGAYVHYDAEVTFAILALESQRNRCVIIGEDLGTVPDQARYLLNRYQVFSYKVMYFSKGWNGFQLPEEYPEQAITVISTHDVAPLAGYWTGKDLDTMFKLGTLPDAAAFQTALDEREHDKADLLDKLKETGCLGADVQMPAKADETLLAALHKYGALSRSKLYAVQLENLLGVIDNLNVPGVPDGYPNWAQKMPVSLEDFLQHRLMGGQLAIIDEVRMKTNSQIKAYHELDQIERDTVESLFLATHSDVFAYLGRHRLAEGDEVVRVLIPGAVSVDIVNRRSGELIVPSEKIDERGFFVAVLPDDAPDYALSIRYTEDSEPVIEEDPYHFSSALQDMDSWLLAEGKHLRPYETLGAHFAELDGVKGVRFAVWAPNAQRVSVIGEFNNWDGRRHVMRFYRDNGIWDIFIPAVKLNALYKFEIRFFFT